ncbi:UDP-N-acetylmuramate--L-alanine ligase [Roseivirga misakiensis]|uniref:UDP-N-acetylmuramate--L-alanine ligase n=2 Tax=Roseivirga misakiensis TaxID=1563681 RepID=A0A1E5SK59_9BACT|nr:UDP-N-acetylmuramate--L-alanine ligase [Roseivirga misakiensis]
MSALARWFKHNGKAVSGYDRTETDLTRSLQSEGIAIHFQDDLEHIAEAVKLSTEGVLVVYTPAIPSNHKGLNWFRANQYPLMKRSEVLGLITQNMKNVAVAGTHGKTTTSSMIVHLLKTAGIDCTGFLGGISANYNTNMILNDSEDSIAVIEADEFDRSFLTLHPDIAVVTATDADHLDIYGDKEALKDSFRQFVDQINDGGHLFVKHDLKEDFTPSDKIRKTGYGLAQGAIKSTNLRIEDAAFVFDYSGSQTIEGVRLNVPGYHNVENMLAAMSVCSQLGADAESLKTGVSTYKGVKRRFEFIHKSADVVYIDDYAHHPVEIEMFLKSVRDLFPTKKVTAVFQPHLFTRTRDFAEGFSESLSLADEVILLDIYPARELPIEGVSSALLLKDIRTEKKTISTKENLISQINNWKPEVLVTIGAGDIDKLVEPIKNSLL